MAVTFPYTPGFTHGEDTSFQVKVFRFDDDTEQRYLQSRQRGLGLTYHWTAPDSSLIQQVTSFYQTYFGQAFEVVDHRTGAVHLARFAGDTFSHLRTVAQRREMRIQFVTVQDTQTDPVITSVAPPPQPNCFVLSFTPVNTPGFGVDSGPATPGVDSGTIVMSGNSIPGSEGADINFWRMASHAIVSSTWYTSLNLGIGTIGGAGTAPDRNTLYAAPFICERSGATIEAMGIHIKTITAGAVAPQCRVAIYEARSIDNFDMVPGSLALNVGCVSVNSAGWNWTTTSYSFKSGRLYYLTLVHSIGGAFALGAYSPNNTAAVICNDQNFDSVFGFTASYAVTAAFPDTFPTSMTPGMQDTVPFFGLKFQT